MKESTAAYLGLGALLFMAVAIGLLVSLRMLDDGRPFFAAVFVGGYCGFVGTYLLGLIAHRLFRLFRR